MPETLLQNAGRGSPAARKAARAWSKTFVVNGVRAGSAGGRKALAHPVARFGQDLALGLSPFHHLGVVFGEVGEAFLAGLHAAHPVPVGGALLGRHQGQTRGVAAVGPPVALGRALGLPDGGRDMVVERTHPLEAGFDELGGVDWKKGCYLGQEQMTRTKFRGELHKRLIPVAIDGEAPPPGTTLTLGGEEAGQMASSADDIGLAMIRLEALKTLETDGGALDAPGGVRLTPRKPAWIAL